MACKHDRTAENTAIFIKAQGHRIRCGSGIDIGTLSPGMAGKDSQYTKGKLHVEARHYLIQQGFPSNKQLAYNLGIHRYRPLCRNIHPFKALSCDECPKKTPTSAIVMSINHKVVMPVR